MCPNVIPGRMMRLAVWQIRIKDISCLSFWQVNQDLYEQSCVCHPGKCANRSQKTLQLSAKWEQATDLKHLSDKLFKPSPQRKTSRPISLHVCVFFQVHTNTLQTSAHILFTSLHDPRWPLQFKRTGSVSLSDSVVHAASTHVSGQRVHATLYSLFLTRSGGPSPWRPHTNNNDKQFQIPQNL